MLLDELLEQIYRATGQLALRLAIVLVIDLLDHRQEFVLLQHRR